MFCRNARRALSFFNLHKIGNAHIGALTLIAPIFALMTIEPRAAFAQQTLLAREIAASEGVEIVIKNPRGRVSVTAADEARGKVSVRAELPGGASAGDVKINGSGALIEIAVETREKNAARVDLILRTPPRSKVRIETTSGAVDLVGDIARAAVSTTTGTLRADVPVDNLRYDFHWTASRPRVFSEVRLAEPKERRGGRFELSGELKADKSKEPNAGEETSDAANVESNGDNKSAPPPKNEGTTFVARHFRLPFRRRAAKSETGTTSAQAASIEFATERGLLLFGVSDPALVPSDLRERQLTEAARAIIRSGNEGLIEDIHRVSPRFVDEYAARLPHRRDLAPQLRERAADTEVNAANRNALVASRAANAATQQLIRFNASVTDEHGRAINNLTAQDFTLFENNERRQITSLAPTNAPFNLVLILDVSGSVEERLDLIRKAARSFVAAAGAQDRIAVITFSDDVKLISDFTSDKSLLNARVNDIEAGGATALYDALAYALLDTIKQLHGERIGVVVLSDGDDNRSFIPFPSVLEAVVESGAIIYPLYVPSGLTPEGHAPAPLTTLDPTRTRFLSLTSRAEEEGRKLAEASGGTYFPITRLDELPRAFADVVAQLRTAYTITYASAPSPNTGVRRIKVRVNRPNAEVRLSPAVELNSADAASPQK